MENRIRLKLEEIEKAKEQTVAQLNALIGAERILKELLSKKEEE